MSRSFIVCVSAAILGLFAVPRVNAAGNGWAYYGGGPGGMRYSALAQITSKNVKHLKVAWIYRTGETGRSWPKGEWKGHMTFEATPILYDGTLYFTTSYTNVVAINAATGKLRWRYNTHVQKLRYSDAASRGVSLWVDSKSRPGAVCHARIFAPTLDGRLLALDAATGKLCKDFGDHGAVDLLHDIRSTYELGDQWRNYLVTSPPAVIDGKVIVGSSIGDNRGVNEELGIVRAYDARTGKLLWRWDPIPRSPANPVYKEWTPKSAKISSAANAWAPLSADPVHHLVYVPTGSASPDFFGGERLGPDRWANSLVALNAGTGKFVWGRQLVHHNLWDYDLPAQPTLVELTHNGQKVPAVIQTTKMGMLFTFNRLTGKPIFPIVEKKVPQGGVKGEVLSKTQPFPTAPPPLVRQGPVTPEDAWGLTFWDKGRCRDVIKKFRSDGIYTPPSLQGSIELPSYAGGSEWGGIAFDPINQIAVVNTNNLPAAVALVPRNRMKKEENSGKYKGWDFSDMNGTPYGMRRRVLLSPLGIPCTAPPWGQLAAVDMVHGKILWQVPLGVTPIIHKTIGVPNMGGPIVTAGGVIFIAATADDDIRAFDLETGKMLWQYHLPAGGQATPMTYSINGRQYVVIVAGGHGGLGTKRGDYVIAFALPPSHSH
ncbi:MAG: pyrroloquinoline quinone-dependent dehydrogenase [Gammaproteobacteria bacterium]